MTTLRNTISELASQFAAGVLHAIKGASLEDILAETNGASPVRRGPGRPPRAAAAVAASASVSAVSQKRGGAVRRRGRLERRSADDIASIVEQIVTLLEKNPEGLRAEQIRQELGLEAKELPRPIAEALSSRKIAKQGQKRATTYFARGAGRGSTAGGKAAGAKRGAKKTSGRGRKAKRGSKASGESASSNGASGS